jgi:predicted RNA-binding protein with PIN domain
MIARRTDAAREGLVELVRALVRSGRMKAPVTVVFDGRPSDARASDAGGVEVRFAPHPDTADRLIGDAVEHGAAGEEFAVVTSDREVQSRVRRLGAKVIGVRKFMEAHVPQGRRARVPARPAEDEDAASEKPAGPLLAPEVRRWLRRFGLEEQDAG